MLAYYGQLLLKEKKVKQHWPYCRALISSDVAPKRPEGSSLGSYSGKFTIWDYGQKYNHSAPLRWTLALFN